MAYSDAAWRRAMTVQEVVLKALSGEIHWFRAADILGMSARTLRRWRERYEQYGYVGLVDKRRQSPSVRRVAAPEVDGGDQTDADGFHYYQRSMGSMGDDASPNDSRVRMNPAVNTGESWVRVYHPNADMWVLAPEFNTTSNDWSALLRRLSSSGSELWSNLQPCRFKIVVCKTNATAATCNVNWPN